MQRARFHIVGLIGRVAIVLTLILAILLPQLSTDPRARDLIVLWDDSISMKGTDQGPAWQRLIDFAERFPVESRVGLLRFAAEPAVELALSTDALAALATTDAISAPRTAALDRTRTDLGAAIAAGLRIATPARGAALAVLSDGRDTDGRAEALLESARRSGVPVYALLPEPDPAPLIREIRVAPRINIGQTVPADVILNPGAAFSGDLFLMLDDSVVGSTSLNSAPNETLQVRFWVSPDELGIKPGSRVLQAELRSERTSQIARRQQGIEINGPSEWLAISREPRSSVAIRQLRSSGWPIVSTHAEAFPGYTSALGNFSGIILDDLAVIDLPQGAWSSIDNAVRNQGTTLLILGGPNSFGAGGYRDSALESLLPVTIETNEPRPVAAVQFVIDASGSMGKGIAAISPMSFARRAVLDTSRVLGPNDQIGMIAFDVDPQVLLPLQTYADPIAAMQSASGTLGPSGGTRLLPALQAALHEFDQTSASRRILVLATDGFFDNEDLAPVIRTLRDRKIELIVLAIGRGANLARIEKLAGPSNVFPVHDVATLPLLMRTEVERRKNPVYRGPVDVTEIRAIPFLTQRAAWPRVTGFARTRARSSATVYLQAHSGDPLLAVHHAGVGRVAVLPAGLADWAPDWQRWPGRKDTLAAMQRWLGQRSGDGHLFLATQTRAGAFEVTVDATGDDADWSDESNVTVTLVDPAQRATTSTAKRVAPGRFSVNLPARQLGGYLIGVTDGDHQVQRTVYRDANAELRSLQRPSPVDRWLRAGLLRPWPPEGEPLAFSAGSARTSIYPGLLLAVLILYFALIAFPRREAIFRSLARPYRQGLGG